MRSALCVDFIHSCSALNEGGCVPFLKFRFALGITILLFPSFRNTDLELAEH